jgi:hypothetical protein
MGLSTGYKLVTKMRKYCFVRSYYPSRFVFRRKTFCPNGVFIHFLQVMTLTLSQSIEIN